jgi:CDP-diacylglycerol--glycerol-3-phosphate 3-phosphatidyltransferase
MLDTNFQKAEKVLPLDKIIDFLFLRFFPNFIKPNHITVFRFLATPVVAFFMFFGHHSIGFVMFLIVAFTDALDGAMARTRNQITEWGKVYDPLADKILIGSMVFIIVLRYVDFWTSIIIIGLELVIIITAWIRKLNGYKVEANLWGKIKMMLQVLGVSILLLSIIFDLAALLPFASGVLYLAIAFAIVSLLTYGI